jgi:RecA-family ATPase
MAVDIGTLGSSPSLIAINKMLIAINDAKITNRVTRCFLQPKEEIAKLKAYVKDRDISFYIRLLSLLREQALAKVDKHRDDLEKDLYTHLRCAVVGLFREAAREVAEAAKENIRRRQRGQKPL